MPVTRRFAALFVIAAAVAIPVTGCGGGSDDNSTSNAATQASTAGGGTAAGAGGAVNLSATEYKFDPSEPTVKSGDVTFTLKNAGQQAHSLEIEDVNGQDQEIEGDVSPGQSGTLSVNLKPGKYEFYCPVDGHKDLGMEGEIIVK